jgi:integrase
MQVKLTSSFVATVKAKPGAERTLFWDAEIAGFGLMVTRGGHKSFVVQYRAGGVSRRLTMSGVLQLQAARKQARGVLGDVARGRDPLGERRKAAAAPREAFRSIAEEYLKREGKRLRTARDRRVLLERLVYPRLGVRQVSEIKRSDIVRLLDQIEDTNGPVMADRTLAAIRRVMSWHASRSDDFRSPIVRGMARTKPKEREREKVLTDEELCAIWTAAESCAKPWGQFIRFLLLTATRRNEAARMGWAEVTGEDWTIPATRYKTSYKNKSRDVAFPLSKAAGGVLTELPKIEGCRFVFTTNGTKPISGFSKFKRAFDKSCGVEGWTLHDLRRTARSLMSRAGVAPDIAERCLGHVIPGVRAVYDRYPYRKEMAEAFEALASQIDIIVRSSGAVVQLRGNR